MLACCSHVNRLGLVVETPAFLPNNITPSKTRCGSPRPDTTVTLHLAHQSRVRRKAERKHHSQSTTIGQTPQLETIAPPEFRRGSQPERRREPRSGMSAVNPQRGRQERHRPIQQESLPGTLRCRHRRRSPLQILVRSSRGGRKKLQRAGPARFPKPGYSQFIESHRRLAVLIILEASAGFTRVLIQSSNSKRAIMPFTSAMRTRTPSPSGPPAP